jgi:hypothetical protein
MRERATARDLQSDHDEIALTDTVAIARAFMQIARKRSGTGCVAGLRRWD